MLTCIHCIQQGRYVFLVQQSAVMNFLELKVFAHTCTACAANTYDLRENTM